MSKFIESNNKDGQRIYLNVNHIVSVDETGKYRCLIITDIPPAKDSVLPFYYTVDAPYDEVVALIKEEDKYGEWIFREECGIMKLYACSLCGYELATSSKKGRDKTSKYCGGCGVEMRGKRE